MPPGELCQFILAQVGAVCLLLSEFAAGGAVWLSCHFLKCLPPPPGIEIANKTISVEGSGAGSTLQRSG